MVDTAYRFRTKEYAIETTNKKVANAKATWMAEVNELRELIKSDKLDKEKYETQLSIVEMTYKNFIKILEEVLALLEKEGE
jgi:hypothetical protein